MSISVTILCYGSINVYGLFGEIIISIVVDEEQEIVNIKSIDHEKVQTTKGINVFNVWFEILIAVVWANLIKLQ